MRQRVTFGKHLPSPAPLHGGKKPAAISQLRSRLAYRPPAPAPAPSMQFPKSGFSHPVKTFGPNFRAPSQPRLSPSSPSPSP